MTQTTSYEDIAQNEEEARKLMASQQIAEEFIAQWISSAGKVPPPAAIDRSVLYDAAIAKISRDRLRVTLYCTKNDLPKEHIETLRQDEIPACYADLIEYLRLQHWEGGEELWEWDLGSGRLWVVRGGKHKIVANEALYRHVLEKKQKTLPAPSPQQAPSALAPSPPGPVAWPFGTQAPAQPGAPSQAPAPQLQPPYIDWEAMRQMQSQAAQNPLANNLIAEMRAQHQAQATMLRDQIQALTTSLREEKEAAQRHLKEQLEAQRSLSREQVENLRSQWDMQRDGLMVRIKNLEDENAAVRRRLEEDRASESAERKRLEEERQRMVREIEQMRSIAEQKVSAKEAELAEARANAAAHERTIAQMEAEAEREAERREHEKEREMHEALSEQRERIGGELSEAREKHTADMARLREQERENAAQQERLAQEAIAKITNEYEARIARMASEHLTALDTQKQQMEMQTMARIAREVENAIGEKDRVQKQKSVVDRAIEAQRVLDECRKELEGVAKLMGLNVQTPEEKAAAAATLAATSSQGESSEEKNETRKQKLFGLLTADGDLNMELVEAIVGPLVEREGKKILERYEKIEEHNQKIADDSSARIAAQEASKKEEALRERIRREEREKMHREMAERERADRDRKQRATSIPKSPAPLFSPPKPQAPAPAPAQPAPAPAPPAPTPAPPAPAPPAPPEPPADEKPPVPPPLPEPPVFRSQLSALGRKKP